MTAQYLRDAGEKAASVRALRRTSVPVLSAGARVPAKTPAALLAGIVALDSSWGQEFRWKLPLALCAMAPEERLDLGCALEQGAFELRSTARGLVVRLSVAQESLIFFVIRLLERLRDMGTAPACDLMEYGRSLESFCGREVVLERPGMGAKERE